MSDGGAAMTRARKTGEPCGSYCSVCGSPMVVVGRNTGRYDGRQGTEVIDRWVVCPRYRQRRILFIAFGNGHECAEAAVNYFDFGRESGHQEWIKRRDSASWLRGAPDNFLTLPSDVYRAMAR